MTLDRTTYAAGTLWLEAPDWSELDGVTGQGSPWILWRVGFQTVLAHWMDEAVRRNVAKVEIIASDRTDEVERALKGGVFWSREIIVHATRPADAPGKIESMAGLPQQPAPARPTSEAELLSHWHTAQLDWLKNRDEKISLDRQLHPRVWIGPGAVIHPGAKLSGPCWIGSRAQIGAEAVIGPNAIVGSRSVVDQDASVCNATVMPDTFVGSKLRLQDMIADGNILLDVKRGTRVEIVDRFMMAPLQSGFWSRLFGPKKP